MKKPVSTFLYFFVTCLVAVLFLFSPLIFRIECMRTLASIFLSGLQSDGYITTYVETVGAILGTFLAITGALWTQSISDRNAELAEIQRNALITYYDLYSASEAVLRMMKAVYYRLQCSDLSDDRLSIDIFRTQKRLHRIYLTPNWMPMISSLSKKLPPCTIRDIQILYEQFSMICMSLNADVTEFSKKEDANAYCLMRSMIRVSPDNPNAKHNFIYIAPSTLTVLCQLKELSMSR